MEPDHDDTLARLAAVSGCSELYRVTRFVGYRKLPGRDVDREVRIEIWDRGPGDWNRYHVHAQDQDGRKATGNPEGSLDVAIAVVHWGELDRDPAEGDPNVW